MDSNQIEDQFARVKEEETMKKENVKIGMRVVPHQKTVFKDMGLEDSGAWEEARNRNQEFLYVVEWESGFNAFVLNYEDNLNGDYFKAEDFELYEEDGLKDKLLKLQQLYKNMMELQYEINGEFHDKSISISQEINGSWDNDGYNLRINRVDIRTDDFGILFDVIEHGEQIECVDGIGIDQFIKYGELTDSVTLATVGL